MLTTSNKPVILFVENGLPTQSKIVMSETDYQYALRVLIEHCIQDYGLHNTTDIVNYALFKNNLPEVSDV